MTGDFEDALKGFNENALCANAVASRDASPGLTRAVMALAYAMRAQAIATSGLAIAAGQIEIEHGSLATTARFHADAVERIAAAMESTAKGRAL